jgi:hypothetical protein
MRKKIVARYLALAAGFFSAAALGYGRGIDTVVEVPTTRDSALVEVPTTATPPPVDDSTPSNLTLGRESKNVVDEKAVVEQEKTPSWIWSADGGYDSEYIFRGTNLTPGSKGIGYFDASVTKLGVFQNNDSFTFGVTGIHQFGRASVQAWSIGEGGGGGTAQGAFAGSNVGNVKYFRFPETEQTRFNELDLYLSYRFSVGPIDVTIGDIGFLIDRDANTFEADVLPRGFFWLIPPTGTRTRILGPDPTVQDEEFDRAYIRLSTNKLAKYYITPQITYYQTLLSEGDGPSLPPFLLTYPPDVNGNVPVNPRPHNERNPEHYGGYLEGKILGRFPVTRWMDIDPYALVSVSFRDRTEPGGANPYAGHPLTGWNHAQAGVKVPIRIMHFQSSGVNVFIAPFTDYAYHIAHPPAGTDKDELTGGGEVQVTF